MKFKKHKDQARMLERLLRDSKKRDFLIRQAHMMDKDNKLTDSDIQSIIDNILKGASDI